MLTKITGNVYIFAICKMLHSTGQKCTHIGATTLKKSRHTNFSCKVNTSVSSEAYNFLCIYCPHLLTLLQDLAKRQIIDR